MLANFHMFGIMLLLRVVLNMLMRSASPRLREVLCVLGALYLVWQDPVSCFFCFVVLRLESGLW